MNINIRKISIGNDYPNGVIHYQVGKNVRLQGVSYTIHSIHQITEKIYEIYLNNNDGTILWKKIENMPVVVEDNIDFD